MTDVELRMHVRLAIAECWDGTGAMGVKRDRDDTERVVGGHAGRMYDAVREYCLRHPEFREVEERLTLELADQAEFECIRAERGLKAAMDWVQQTGVLEQETEATRENLLLELT